MPSYLENRPNTILCSDKHSENNLAISKLFWSIVAGRGQAVAPLRTAAPLPPMAGAGGRAGGLAGERANGRVGPGGAREQGGQAQARRTGPGPAENRPRPGGELARAQRSTGPAPSGQWLRTGPGPTPGDPVESGLGPVPGLPWAEGPGPGGRPFGERARADRAAQVLPARRRRCESIATPSLPLSLPMSPAPPVPTPPLPRAPAVALQRPAGTQGSPVGTCDATRTTAAKPTRKNTYLI